MSARDMRLWTLLAPLDRQALVACWREGLLAQAALLGKAPRYARHPQLRRFFACPDPLAALAAYLRHVADEAEARGYRFDRDRIVDSSPDSASPPYVLVSAGQVRYEIDHLERKIAARQGPPDPLALARLARARCGPLQDLVCPLFLVDDSDERTEPWEKLAGL